MLEAIFQNPSQQVIAKYKPQVNQINNLEREFKSLPDLDNSYIYEEL